MCLCTRAPLGSRCIAAVLAVGAALDAAALGVVFHEPLGDAIIVVFFLRLRGALILYITSLGVLCVLSVLAVVDSRRPLLALVAVVGAGLAAASAALACAVGAGAYGLGPLLREECLGRDRGRGGGGSSGGLGRSSPSSLPPPPPPAASSPSPQGIVAFVDLGIEELAEALDRCRAGFRPDALTLDDCPGLARELDISGDRFEYFARLERALETRLPCAGLCRQLDGPLFAASSLHAVHGQLPACWRPLSAAVSHAGRVLAIWLGFLSAPALLLAACAILLSIVIFPGRSAVPSGGYQLVPSVAVEAILSPMWPD